MEIRGGEAPGIIRIEQQSSLQFHGIPTQINLSFDGRDKYWWSWRRIRYLASFIKKDGIMTAGNWRRFAAICHVVSEAKRDYLYGEIKSQFSEASLSYLFGPEYIARRTQRVIP